MLSLRRPPAARLRSIAARLVARPLSYRAGLLEHADTAHPPTAPWRKGWFVDRHSATIGNGRHDFAAARDGLRNWRPFDPEWTVSMAPPALIERGVVVAYSARVLGLWWTYGCRILEVIDEPSRFGFVYGTLAGHAERGEERFQIELDADDDVVFSLLALSRPGRWFSWPAMPLARRTQARFRRTAALSMHAAVLGSRRAVISG